MGQFMPIFHDAFRVGLREMVMEQVRQLLSARIGTVLNFPKDEPGPHINN